MIEVTGVVLAGGLGSRMDGIDKGLVEYQGKPMISWVLDCLKNLDELIVVANRSYDDYKSLGYKVIKDEDKLDVESYAGPLLGIYTALKVAKTPWVLFSPCDTPKLPDIYTHKMIDSAMNNLSLAVVANDGERVQPLHILLNRSLAENLLLFLLSGKRKTFSWLDQISPLEVDFSDYPEGFANFNSFEDLK